MFMPLQQGNLDGLCGLYSTLNAIGCILKINNDSYRKLFEIGLEHLNKRTNLKNTILNGISLAMIKEIFNKYNILLNDWGWRLHVKQIAIEAGNITGLASKMKEWLEEENQCIVVGIGGKMDHWSCISRQFANSIKLVDSDGRKRICLRNITIGSEYGKRVYTIQPEDVLGIRIDKLIL